MTNNDYQKLSGFLSKNSIYENDFNLAQSQGLHDYQGLLIWKTFIFFCYEKIQQTRKVLGEETFFASFWNHESTSDIKKYPLEKFDNTNIYCYSDLEDEIIVRMVARIFQLEKNYIDLLTSLKKKRDYSAHVVRRDLFGLKDIDISDILDKIICVCETISEKYKNTYLQNIEDSFLSEINLSGSEINYFIDHKINSLSTSKSFNSSESLMKILEKNFDKLSQKSIESILEAIKNGQIIYGYNQALDLNYSTSFLTNLLAQSQKIGSDLTIWKSFYEGLGKSDQERFVEIKRSLQNSGIEFNFINLKYTEPYNIPF
mgnify:CR=1 FL=1